MLIVVLSLSRNCHHFAAPWINMASLDTGKSRSFNGKIDHQWMQLQWPAEWDRIVEHRMILCSHVSPTWNCWWSNTKPSPDLPIYHIIHIYIYIYIYILYILISITYIYIYIMYMIYIYIIYILYINGQYKPLTYGFMTLLYEHLTSSIPLSLRANLSLQEQHLPLDTPLVQWLVS